MNIDGSEHILSYKQVKGILDRFKPKSVIPAHYLTRGAVLKTSTLESADEWVGMQKDVVRLDSATFTLDQSALNRDAQIVRYDYNTGAATSITFRLINGSAGGISNYAFMNSVFVVPEPSTLALLLLAGFWGVVRRRR